MDDTQAQASRSPAPGRRKHRVLKAALASLILSIAFIAALPWLLGTPPGRALILGRVNARLAPGSVRVDGLGLSWVGPMSLDGVALVDPKGKLVLAAKRVTLDRSILGLILSKSDYGTITAEGVAVDVERRADGSIDLLDALASVRTPDAPSTAPAPPPVGPAAEPAPSTMAVKVVVMGGTLKLASPELVEPLMASELDASVTIAPGKPMELSADLGESGRSLAIRSTMDSGASGARVFSVVGKDWPIHVRQSGVEAKGRFAGELEAREDQGLWSAKGDAALGQFEALGPALKGDRMGFDRVSLACQVKQTAAGWSIGKLDFTCPVASLQGAGTIPAADGTPTEVRGRVDLAAMAKMLPNAMSLRDGLTLDQGSVTLKLDVTSDKGVDRADLVAGLDDFAATEAGRAVRLRKPVYLAARANRTAKKVTVESMEVKAAGVDVTGSGDLEAGVKLAGTVDLVTLTAQLRDVLDLGTLDLSGRARVAADYHHLGETFKGRFAAEFKDLKVVGPTAEPIVRTLVRLDASAVGPSKPDGTPADWREARLDLKADDLKLDVVATSTEGAAALNAGFEMQVASPVAGRLDAKARFRRKGTVYEVDELTAGITPTDPKAAAGVVALAIKGQFDTASGEGAFAPIKGFAPGAVGLGPEGAKVSGLGKTGVPIAVDADLLGDLAAIDQLLAEWSGSPLKGLSGAWSSRIVLGRTAAGKVDLDGKITVPDLVYTTPRGPVTLALKGVYNPEIDRLDLPSIDLATAFGKVSLVFGLLETQGRRLMDLTGTIEPDWAAIDPLITKSVEPNARVRATIRPIHLAGSLKHDTTDQLLGQLFGEAGLDLTQCDAFGLKLGQTPIVLKMGGGKALFDPIRSTLNDGPVSITADLTLDAEDGVFLRLGASRVDGAAINEAVSNALLAYVAPVMAKSSSVSGKVTMAIDQALVPITAKGALSLDGALAFQNVVFKPGPFATELNSVTGQSIKDIRLDEAMFVKIADGRVQQKGLTIPVGGNGLKVAIDGSVGFDETLDLKATVPLSAKALGLAPSFDKLAQGTTVNLPIRGTLARPAIDRKALAVALRDAARGLGEKELKGEAGRFLDRIAGPSQSAGEPRTKSKGRNPLGDLENLGREILDQKKP